ADAVEHHRGAAVGHAVFPDGAGVNLAVGGLAIAHRAHAVRRQAGTDQIIADGLGTSLAQALVGAVASGGIGEAFDGQQAAGMAVADHLGQLVQRGLVLVAQVGGIRVEMRHGVDADLAAHLGDGLVVLGEALGQLLPEAGDGGGIGVGLGLDGAVARAQLVDGGVVVGALHVVAAADQCDQGGAQQRRLQKGTVQHALFVHSWFSSRKDWTPPSLRPAYGWHHRGQAARLQGFAGPSLNPTRSASAWQKSWVSMNGEAEIRWMVFPPYWLTKRVFCRLSEIGWRSARLPVTAARRFRRRSGHGPRQRSRNTPSPRQVAARRKPTLVVHGADRNGTRAANTGSRQRTASHQTAQKMPAYRSCAWRAGGARSDVTTPIVENVLPQWQ